MDTEKDIKELKPDCTNAAAPEAGQNPAGLPSPEIEPEAETAATDIDSQAVAAEPEDRSWVKKVVIFFASQTVSIFGSTVVGYSIIWYITLATSSGMMMTIATLCNFLPQILISPIAGVWADRYSRKLMIIIADSCVAIFTLILAVTFIRGNDAMWLIFFVLALRSLFSGIQAPAVGAILPQLVPQEHLMRVNALNSTITSATTLLSPVVGG